MKPPRNMPRRNERGVVIIWSAFFMIMMLGFVALGIDVAKIMTTRTELQNAADGAALAGASALDLVTGQIMPDTAVARAQQTALRNKAFVDSPTPITLLAGDVQVNAAERTVRATVRRDPTTDGAMITHVAQVLGIRNVNVSATATAKAERTCQQCERLVPMGALPPPGGGSYIAGCSQTYNLVENVAGGSNGNWQALSFPECGEGPCAGMSATGAATLRCLIENGYACCVSVGDIIQTEPGVNAGPIRMSLQDRWDADRNRDPDICYSDYLTRGGNGMRVVNVPMIQSLGGGRTDVRVLGFGAFFLKRRPTGPGQSVPAEFVYDMVPGTGGNCNSTVFTIRLIQ